MASGGSSTSLAQKLDCAICLERYRRPKLLPCFHTFCQECLEKLVGSASSFRCPACRKAVPLPCGGIATLQTNFYITEDLERVAASNTRFCEVCPGEKDATHKCLQCCQRYCDACRRVHDSCTFGKSHIVVSLQKSLADDMASDKIVDQCLKHPSQQAIMRCLKCKLNICIQCKLISHEGHLSEDISDSATKAKTKLQNLLETMTQQKRTLENILATVDQQCVTLREQQRTAKEELQGRADTLLEWVQHVRNASAETVQSVTDAMVASLRLRTEHLQEKHVSLAAQCDHVTRVLGSGRDSDIVSLPDQMAVELLNQSELMQLNQQLQTEITRFVCKHNPTAVGQREIWAFIGEFDQASLAIETPGTSLISSRCTSEITTTETEIHRKDTILDLPSKKAPREEELILKETSPKMPLYTTYSTNPRSEVVGICPVDEKRVWIKHKVGTRKMMGLFDKHGSLLEHRDDPLFGDKYFTILDNQTVSEAPEFSKAMWISPGDRRGTIDFKRYDVRPVGKTRVGKTRWGNDQRQTAQLFERGTSSIYVSVGYCFVFIESLQPLKWNHKIFLADSSDRGQLADVSACDSFFAFIGQKKKNTLGMYTKNPEEENEASLVSTYSLKKGLTPSDACFCSISDREMLLVAVEKDNAVHVVDYANDCRFVRKLTSETVVLDRPCLLATDHDTHVWIGCHGGQVVRVHL